MKDKIFAKLKQEFSHLGLGSDILLGHADALAKTGLVTDENVDLVVSVQKDYLEGLQKLNDKRVDEALRKEREKQQAETRRKAEEAEAAAKAKEEEAAKAQAEKEKAEKAAADKKAKEDAEKAAAEKKAAEDKAAIKALEQEKAIPAAVIEILKAERERVAAERKEYEQRIADMMAAGDARQTEYLATIKKLQEEQTALQSGYNALKQENDQARAAKAAADRAAFILNKAKELGVPQWRIDEGFALAPDAAEDVIAQTLSKVAENIKTEMLPSRAQTSLPVSDGSLSKDEIASLAGSIVK